MKNIDIRSSCLHNFFVLQFPGTGHRLSSSNQPSNMMSMHASSHDSSTGSSHGGGGASLSREEVAARRLATLSQSAAYGNVKV